MELIACRLPLPAAENDQISLGRHFGGSSPTRLGLHGCPCSPADAGLVSGGQGEEVEVAFTEYRAEGVATNGMCRRRGSAGRQPSR